MLMITSSECTVPLFAVLQFERQLLVTQLDRPLSKNKDKYNTYTVYVKVVKMTLRLVSVLGVFQLQFCISPQWISFR